MEPLDQKKPRVLFVADKWCAGTEAFGAAEWEQNLWQSLEATGLAEVRTFHFDEYHARNKKRGDDALLQAMDENRPDFICLVLYKMPGADVNVLNWQTLKEIKKRGIPVLCVWGDLEMKEQIDISKALLPYVSVNLATASSAALSRINNPEKYLYMWVPKNPRIFNDPELVRDIDLSYVGSPKKDRLRRLRYLEEHGVPVTWTGGERQAHLSVEEYAGIFKRSKITIGFSRAHVSHVINARPFEAMLCGAMMLEQENFETPKLYTPFVDFVPYVNNADLLEKASYYLAHDEERIQIAQNGRRKTAELYSARRFWETALGKMLNIPAPAYTFSYALTAKQLSTLPPVRSLRLRFLNVVCSNPISFSIYAVLHEKFWENHLWRLFKYMRVFLEHRVSEKTFTRLLRLKRKYFNLF